MATTTLEPQTGSYRRSWVIDWLTTVDHKKIGILYIVNSFLFFFCLLTRSPSILGRATRENTFQIRLARRKKRHQRRVEVLHIQRLRHSCRF